MNHFPWQSHCAAAERRAVRLSSEAVDDGGERTKKTSAADRSIFTRTLAGAIEPIFIVSSIVRRCESVAAGAENDRFSRNAFSLPVFRSPPGEYGASILVALHSAGEHALHVPFAEPRATSTHYRASSPPIQGDSLGIRTTATPAAGQQHPPSISNLLAPAQQYLQALREDISPPPALHEAWDVFYQACDPLVRRTVAACSYGRAEVDDCIQECWAEITAKLTRFEYDPNRGSFEAWLRIVVHRAACRHGRRDHRQTTGRIDQDLAGVKCPRILGPATTSQREELRASVRQSLDAFRTSVSSTAFRILLMTTVHGQTSTEIGQLLGLSPGHVRVTRHRTVKKFRQFVAAQPGLAEAYGVRPLPTQARRNQ